MGLLHDLIWNTYKAGDGGGSSDFSTATVTIAEMNEYDETTMFLPIVDEDQNNIMIAPVAAISGATVNVAMYKNSCITYVDTGSTITVTGDIVYNNGELIISGDGTISIELPK